MKVQSENTDCPSTRCYIQELRITGDFTGEGTIGLLSESGTGGDTWDVNVYFLDLTIRSTLSDAVFRFDLSNVINPGTADEDHFIAWDLNAATGELTYLAFTALDGEVDSKGNTVWADLRLSLDVDEFTWQLHVYQAEEPSGIDEISLGRATGLLSTQRAIGTDPVRFIS